MSRTIKVAAVQMDASPAPAAERLARADDMVAEAASSGAQLIVLPEMFNTGYGYHETNYENAEPIDGQTVTWMKSIAAQYQVHVAGTLYLLDDEDIYNAMILVAPDGKLWRYDKNYPWMFERAYYREGTDITIADTELGKLGLMICWDAMHPELWQRYAGKVDMMVISSCPPMVHDPKYILHDGTEITHDMPIFKTIKEATGHAFGKQLLRQSENMGVPVVNTTGTGKVSTPVPLPQLLLLAFVPFKPELIKYIPYADDIRMEMGFFQETYVADEKGQVLSQVNPQQEGYTLAEVTLPDTPSRQRMKQPRFGLPITTYMLDVFGNAVLAPVYRYAVRKAYGQDMAPLRPQTIVWRTTSTLAGIAGGMVGYMIGFRGKSKKKKN